MRHRLLATVAATLALPTLLAGAAQAQSAFDGFASSMALNQMHGANREAMMNSRQRGNTQGSSDAARSALTAQGGQRAQPAANPSALAFRNNPQRTQRNFAQFIARTREMDAASGAQLEQLLGSTDVMSAVAQEIQPLGLSTSNLADAYATWWMNAWSGARGESAQPSRTQAQAVRNQAAQALLAVPAIAGMNDAQKQELAEVYFVQAALIGAGTAAARSDAATLQQFSANVAQGARNSGLDLAAMTLTDNGFIAR